MKPAVYMYMPQLKQ